MSESIMERIAKARCQMTCQNSDCIGGDRCWKLTHGNCAAAMVQEIAHELTPEIETLKRLIER